MNNLNDYDVNVTITHSRCSGGYHEAPLPYEFFDFLVHKCIPLWSGFAFGLWIVNTVINILTSIF